MSAIADCYRRRADAFERKVAAVRPDQWSNQSPCSAWNARDVVDHIITMHGVMLRPIGRELTPAPSVNDDSRVSCPRLNPSCPWLADRISSRRRHPPRWRRESAAPARPT
jgi:hypothetical protein